MKQKTPLTQFIGRIRDLGTSKVITIPYYFFRMKQLENKKEYEITLTELKTEKKEVNNENNKEGHQDF